MSSNLDLPLTLRSGVVLPNRVAVAPLTNTQSNSDGTLHQDEYLWLTKRSGHFGLVSTCAAFVSQEGHAWDGQLGISGDKHLAGLTRLAEGIREAGSIGMVQLYHGGKRATLAPQKISTVDGEDFVAASKEDLERITSDFVAAAKLAEQAGFDGVEIHGANGYLFTQFLATLDNPREDEYGGDIAGRAKFLRETTLAVMKATSPSFMINVRISPVDTWDQRGLVLEDSLQLAKWLADDGVDIIHLSLRDASGPGPFETDKVAVVSAIRSVVPDEVKIATAGGIWTREDAKRALDAGADIVALGRAAIAHLDWPTVSSMNNFEPVLPPWDPNYLKQVGVGDKFIKYLMRGAGMVIGGTPPR